MEISKIQFFFFGCWNEGGCNGNNNLYNIIKQLGENRESYDFGVILGDNICHQNNSQEISNLRNGMKCIGEIEKPLYVVLGTNDAKHCDVVGEQTAESSTWKFRRNYYGVTMKRGNVSMRLIVIDTNLLKDKKVHQNCTLEKINGNYAEMIEFIKQDLTRAPKYDWVIVAGHEPIASFSSEGPKANRKIKLLVKLLGRVPNLIYICAGVHNFQYSTISTNDGIHKVYQVISGTAGAPAEPVASSIRDDKQHAIDDNHSMLLDDTYNPFGYSELVVTDDKLVVVYHKVMPSPQEHIFVLDMSTTNARNDPAQQQVEESIAMSDKDHKRKCKKCCQRIKLGELRQKSSRTPKELMTQSQR